MGAVEEADAAETHLNLCTSMHTLRAASDPQGRHGRAKYAARADKYLCCFFMKTTKSMRSVRTIILPAVPCRDLCYASENNVFCLIA